MKKRCFFILSLGIFLFAFACQKGALSQDSREVLLESKVIQKVFKVEGMVSEFGCTKLIEGKLINLEGVSSVMVDFEEKTVVVDFDSNVLDSQEIISEIAMIATGLYSAEAIE